jgi:hypothetical protein
VLEPPENPPGPNARPKVGPKVLTLSPVQSVTHVSGLALGSWWALVDDLRTLPLGQIVAGIPHIGQLSLP